MVCTTVLHVRVCMGVQGWGFAHARMQVCKGTGLQACVCVHKGVQWGGFAPVCVQEGVALVCVCTRGCAMRLRLHDACACG